MINSHSSYSSNSWKRLNANLRTLYSRYIAIYKMRFKFSMKRILYRSFCSKRNRTKVRHWHYISSLYVLYYSFFDSQLDNISNLLPSASSPFIESVCWQIRVMMRGGIKYAMKLFLKIA